MGVEHAKRLTAVGVLLGTLTFAGESVNHPLHWGYEGKVGPAYWGDLSPEYIMCKIGKNQSPVDINPEGLLKGCLKPIEFHYVADAKYVVNNGHTIKVVTKGESYIVVDGRKFYLAKDLGKYSPKGRGEKGFNL